jgi:flagellar basal-body rod protein FlgG
MMSAASGMKAQQMNVDTIANNLANVNTAGFKRSQVMFQDMLYDTIRAPGGSQGNGAKTPSGVQIGLGTRMVSISKVFDPGSMQVTNRDLDVSINGVGFFRVKLPDGTFAYTRDGAFSKDNQGNLVNSDGYALDGVNAIDGNSTAITIAASGDVSVTVNGQTQDKGQIKLYRFVNPSGLQSMGRNLVQPSAASGDPQEGLPGIDGIGTLQQGTLEQSNVQVVDEMVNLIAAQRAYEVNTKAVQACDDMLQATNSMKR